MGIQGAASAVDRDDRPQGGHYMIPKNCKRLAGVDFPIAGVSRRVMSEVRPVRSGRPVGPVIHTLLIGSAPGFAWSDHSRDGVS